MAIDPSLRERWRDLAPSDLAIWRDERYDGSGVSVGLGDLAPEDRATVEEIYRLMTAIARADAGSAGERGAAIEAMLAELLRPETMRGVDRLGRASLEPATASERRGLLRRALHDVRGGGLTCLVGYGRLLATVADGPARRSLVETCGPLSREHAKMMRNAIHDLDEAERAADRTTRAHPVAHFVSALDGLRLVVAEREATVAAASDARCCVTARCLEASALERALYNLLNNAGRFHADGRIEVGALEVGSVVRWVVENAVAADQASWLREQVGGAVADLFLGGRTRGGEGSGLESATEIVRRCFGLDDSLAAVRGGYVGARIDADRFTAWFHWPIYRPPAGVDACDC